jgi:GT2 family glycosyltransferase
VTEPVEHEGRLWVPGNRWDLIADRIGAGPRQRSAVVVTHFEQPASLARMYAALGELDPARFELVVTDDGSSRPPSPPPCDFPLQTILVGQEDRGFRAGAARNLGAASTTASNLVFLDADTVPAPGTVARLAAWPDAAPDALVVGRRGHVDLTGWTPTDTVAWLRGRRTAPPRRPDPAWLADGYRLTHDLLEVDHRSYRFVISAVMACARSLWDDIGGFDATRNEYGGEDWEFAYRAHNNGALLVHDPTCVAWHAEPDWAQRSGGDDGKDDETLWLGSVIPEPATRGRGIVSRWPDTLIEMPIEPASTAGHIVIVVGDLLSDLPDSRIHLVGDIPRWAARYLGDDPRVAATPPTPQQRQRARHTLTVGTRWRWPPGTAGRLVGALHPDGPSAIDIIDAEGEVVAVASSTRAAGRRRRAASAAVDHLFTRRCSTTDDARLVALDADVDLAATFGTAANGLLGSGLARA